MGASSNPRRRGRLVKRRESGSRDLAAILVASLLIGFLLVLSTAPARAQDTGQGATAGSPALPASGSADEATVTIGGLAVMTLHSQPGGPSAGERVDLIENRLTQIVAVPDIKPSAVVVYAPSGAAPSIYVLGRRFITVDTATVKAAAGASARQVAVHWARRLQQVLPRVDIRLPDEPEPKVPAHPPLLITTSLDKVGGSDGPVVFRGKTVMRLHGIQPGGETAAERADALSNRLNLMAYKLNIVDPDAVKVVPASAGAGSEAAPVARQAAERRLRQAGRHDEAATDESEVIEMGGKPVYTVTEADAKSAKAKSPDALAQSWAKNIRLAMGLPATPTPTPTVQAPPPSAAATPPPPPLSALMPPSASGAKPAPAKTAPSQPSAPGGSGPPPAPGSSTPPPAP